MTNGRTVKGAGTETGYNLCFPVHGTMNVKYNFGFLFSLAASRAVILFFEILIYWSPNYFSGGSRLKGKSRGKFVIIASTKWFF
jgi:hypothetical protein